MNRKNLVIFFATVLFLIGACSLPSRISQTASPTPNPQGGLSQTPPPTGNEPQGGSQTDIQATFPVAPDSQMKSPDNYDPTDPSGSFTILSQANIDTLVKYYADELPTQGWTSRYTDANFTGGVTQYWRKDNVYLSMEFGYEEGQVTIHCQFNRVDPQAAQKLPKDFPLPGQFEMVEAEETSWELYIPQDYTDVTKFYTQKLSALNWKQAPTPEPMQGSCGGNDCGESATFPAGALPTATIDPRQINQLSFTMLDGNVVELTITPHQDGTILDVNLILNNVESAGLPQDVPIYPGASVQLVTPGSAEFLVNTDMNTVENYYNDQLKAAGWAQDGGPIEASGSYLQNWMKGAQKISITLVPLGTTTNLVIECSTCNP